MARVMHVVGVLPDKFCSAFQQFAESSLGAHTHRFIAFFEGPQSSMQRHAGDYELLPASLLARVSFLRGELRRWWPDVVVFHNLFGGGRELRALLALMLTSDLRHRAVWSIWGADVYKFQNRDPGLAAAGTEFWRRALLRQFRYVTAALPGDTDLAKLHYSPRALRFRAFYPSAEMFADDVELTTPSGPPVVQVGNSPDPSNEHGAIFRQLARMEGEFRVFCPLAYGPREVIERLASRGREMFGDRFIGLENPISPAEYFRLLSDVRVAIFNHNRQQALGNVFGLLYRGAKVFVREDTTTAYFLRSVGVPTFDTNLLHQIRSVEQLLDYAPDLPAIRQTLRDHFSVERAAELWDDLIRRIASLSPKPRYPELQ